MFELWRVPHKTVIMISCVQEIVYAFFTIAIRRVGGEQCRYNCNSYSANRMHFWDSSSAVFVINRMNEYSNICDLIIYAKTYEWYEFHLVWYAIKQWIHIFGPTTHLLVVIVSWMKMCRVSFGSSIRCWHQWWLCQYDILISYYSCFLLIFYII